MLVKHKPFRTIPSLMDTILNDSRMTPFAEDRNTFPAVNIKENDNAFIITFAVPGMEKDAFNINVENDILSISAEKKEEKIENEEAYTRREYNYQSFERSFNLPKDMVDNDKVAANYTHGELIITVPKREELKAASRLIEVK